MSQPKHSTRLIELIGKLGAALEPDDVQLLTDAVQTAIRLESGEGFNVVAVVSKADGSPRLDCSWMGMLAQITPEQGRGMALGLMEEAAAAETDAALVTFLRGTNLGEEQLGQALYSLRQIRNQRQPVVGEKQEPPSAEPLSAEAMKRITPFGKKPM